MILFKDQTKEAIPMSKRIHLENALSIWRNHVRLPETSEEHILPSEMYEALVNLHLREAGTSLSRHLNRCSRCSLQMKRMLEAIEEGEVLDFSLLKAAAPGEGQWSGEVSTAGGKYVITLRRSREDPKMGVMTVQVEESYRETLEGKSILVKDVHGRELLRGKVFDGEVSRTITDIDITVPRFFVESFESQEQ
jgi:hypothetical protein